MSTGVMLQSFLCFSFFASMHSFFVYLFSFVLVNSLLSPQTHISTDQFSCADYVVPLTHLFHHIPSRSMMTRPFD